MEYNTKILGFNFSKINAEKSKDVSKDTKINTQISIPEIKKVESNLINKDELLNISFKYQITYSPGIANFIFEGNVMVSADKSTAKDILKQWEDKNMQDDFRLKLYNLIFRKISIKALQLEDELSLPSHIQIPKITKKSEVSK